MSEYYGGNVSRDRVRKALSRYENAPADRHAYGIVRAVNADGSYQVALDGSVEQTRCAAFCSAAAGDRVAVIVRSDGRCDAIGRLGGEIGGGTETIAPTIAERFEALEGANIGKVYLWSGSLSVGSSCTLSEEVEEGDVIFMYPASSNASMFVGSVGSNGWINAMGSVITASSLYMVRFTGKISGTEFTLTGTQTATVVASGNSFKADSETLGSIGVLRPRV